LNSKQILDALSLIKNRPRAGAGAADFSSNIAQGTGAYGSGYAIGTREVGGPPARAYPNQSGFDLNNEAELVNGSPTMPSPAMLAGDAEDGYGDLPAPAFADNLTRYNSPFFAHIPSTPRNLGLAVFRQKYKKGTANVRHYLRGDREVDGFEIRGSDDFRFYPGRGGFPTPFPEQNPPDLPPPTQDEPTTAPYREPGWADSPYDQARAFNPVYRYNPWIFGSSGFSPGYTPPMNLPGSWQGATKIPTFFDQQGYPFAVPVTAPDLVSDPTQRHIPQKKGR
jgi:hypothetical protein